MKRGGAAGEERSRCPVCRARFRSTRECSRCGADLSPLMILEARAFSLRRSAREALERGDAALARELASAAETRRSTSMGRRLALLAGWLAER